MMLNELTAEEKEKYVDVASELRCLVCQNQSIADSQAGLASDLKQKIVDQIREGKNKQEIKQYMEARYGEFILYKPEMSSENLVLWIGPFLILLVGVILARRVIGRNSEGPAVAGQSVPADSGVWAEELYKDKSQDEKS